MGLDMSNFKVIYKNQVFNAVSVMPDFDMTPRRIGIDQPRFLEVWFVNEDGELKIIRDDSSMFKFVRR